MYSERLEVKAAVYAGELIQQGAIGKVIQTINIAPHQVIQRAGDNGGGVPRPGWFWEDVQYGGILCDIGSHQIDQFLFYTGSTQAEVVAAQIANVRHPDHPHFQDFGDMMLKGDQGFGYVRLDWFTPDGLGTWGDGRLFILGTEGYIEVRKYADVAVSARRQQPVHRGWQARPLYRLQQRAFAVRSAVRGRYRGSHAHRPGPGAMPVGGGTVHPRPADRHAAPASRADGRVHCLWCDGCFAGLLGKFAARKALTWPWPWSRWRRRASVLQEIVAHTRIKHDFGRQFFCLSAVMKRLGLLGGTGVSSAAPCWIRKGGSVLGDKAERRAGFCTRPADSPLGAHPR